VVKHWFRNTLFKERQRCKDSPYNFSVPPSSDPPAPPHHPAAAAVTPHPPAAAPDLDTAIAEVSIVIIVTKLYLV